MTFEAVLGLDLSKNHFTACLISLDEKFTSPSKSFKRSKEGIKDLLNWLKKHNFSPSQVLAVMESSNNFWERMFFLLVEAGIQTSVVNPRLIKDFARSLNLRAKTDKLDAKVIALYGARMKPRVLNPERVRKYGQLKNLLRQRKSLLEERVRLDNMIFSMKESVFINERAIEELEKARTAVEEAIRQVEHEIEELVRGDEELSRQVEVLDGIPGVGRINGLTLLVESGGFEGFSGVKGLASYAGLAPSVHESGKRRYRSGRTWGGNAWMRKALYMSAVSLLRSGCKVLKGYYEKLIERGKPKKVALVALAHKVLRIAYALIKKGETFDERKLLRPVSP